MQQQQQHRKAGMAPELNSFKGAVKLVAVIPAVRCFPLCQMCCWLCCCCRCRPHSLGQLERSNAYLMQHAGMAAVRAAVQHSQLLFNRALEQCDADFKASLAAGARAAAPPAAWLRSKLEVPITGERRLSKLETPWF